jgi:hypothetical protein
MSQLNDLQQQPLCDDPLCRGASCELCNTLRESQEAYRKITCPNTVQTCNADNLCDGCLTHHLSLVETRGGAVSGGKARRDVGPLQGFKTDKMCNECRKSLGQTYSNVDFAHPSLIRN